MRQDVAVKHKLTDDGRVSEGDQDLHRAADRKIDDVLPANERHRLAVNLGHLKIELVNVKDVLLVSNVLDRPLLHRAEYGFVINLGRIELSASHVKLVGVSILRERHGTLLSNRLGA